jgi:hypothetical protein
MRFLRHIPVLWLLFALGCSSTDPQPVTKDPSPPNAAAQKLPATILEAVESILSRMPSEDQARLRTTRREDLINDLHSWGRGIRNEFQLWGRNQALLEACGTDSPEGASMVIMEAVWDRLQKK